VLSPHRFFRDTNPWRRLWLSTVPKNLLQFQIKSPNAGTVPPDGLSARQLRDQGIRDQAPDAASALAIPTTVVVPPDKKIVEGVVWAAFLVGVTGGPPPVGRPQCAPSGLSGVLLTAAGEPFQRVAACEGNASRGAAGL